MLKALWLWLLLINGTAFALCGVDKWKAVQGRWRVRERTLLLAAALACGVLTISVLALSPALREYLTQALGSFAPYSQELSGATAVDQKVKVRVVSAVTDRYRVKLYVELTDLTGERIVDENTRLSAKIQREAGEDGLRSRCVGYDPETCTALFELNGNMEEGGKYQEQMRLRITQVRPQQYHEHLLPEDRLQYSSNVL